MYAVTQAQAQEIRDAIAARWPQADGWSHQDGPTLRPAEHEEQPEGCWSIAWEGGPEDWTYRASLLLAGKYPGVLLEPMYSWCLGLYPA